MIFAGIPVDCGRSVVAHPATSAATVTTAMIVFVRLLFFML
jgi:hypothetical protein